VTPLLALLLAAAPAFAGPVGAFDAHAAAPTGFPGAFVSSVRLGMADDPLYASRLLDAFQVNVQAVSGLVTKPAVAGYLEQIATAGQGADALKAALGRQALPPPQASALLIANALARPDQFREILQNLETERRGLGLHAAAILRNAAGTGSPQLIAALHAAGEKRPQADGLTYGPDGRLDVLFDGSRASDGPRFADDAVEAPAYQGDGRSVVVRPSGLRPARP
jgi:hypothetical protein